MNLLEFMLAALLLELTPGPNMAYLAALSVTQGRRAGFLAVAGIAAGLAVHAVLAAVGVGALIQESTLTYEILRWAGVAYLLYLAWEGWGVEAENSPGKARPRHDDGSLFMRGFWSNVFNPKSIVFFVTVVPEFLGAGKSSATLRLALLGTIYVAIATAVHATIVAMGSELKPWFSAGRRRDVTRKVLSAALALVALWLAWSTSR